jgi:hypothetical protein
MSIRPLPPSIHIQLAKRLPERPKLGLLRSCNDPADVPHAILPLRARQSASAARETVVTYASGEGRLAQVRDCVKS